MNTIKSKKILIGSLISLLLGTIFAYVFILNRPPVDVLNEKISFIGIGDVNPPLPGGMCADYILYENYEQADKRADTVIIGDVIKTHDPERYYSENQLTLPEKERRGYVHTVSDVKIRKVIKGKYVPDDIIRVSQFGGSYKEVEYDEHNMYGTVYYQTGERYLFFLSNSINEDALCIPINPQQGDMLIKNGKVTARNKVQFVKDNVSENKAVKALKQRVEDLKAKNDDKSQPDAK